MFEPSSQPRLMSQTKPVLQTQNHTSSTDQEAPKPVVLCILDGWGHRDEVADNAIAQAKVPNWRRFLKQYPSALLATSGAAVGLPAGQMGNSEVGHMNIGAGRVVLQDLPRIDLALAEGTLKSHPGLLDQLGWIKTAHGSLHLMGLLSPGGVHSHQDHMVALAKIAAGRGVPVKIHAFLDGRDTPPASAKDYLTKFEADIAGYDITIATVSGRYWPMDRDHRWDRVKKSYKAMVMAEADHAASALEALKKSYDHGKTDEFVVPTVIGDYQGMQDGDGILMANFRADRAREILSALLEPNFANFTRDRVITFSAAIGMTDYSSSLSRLMSTLFPSHVLTNLLGDVVCEAGMSQLRIAETEKYAHVTFFFNGGREHVFLGEDRILVPSPKVATYDQAPAMSAFTVTEKLEEAIDSGRYNLIVVNFANGDMVGHTGILKAAIEAAECIDLCLGRLEEAVTRVGGSMLVTADHGNLEMMRDPISGSPHTAHTTGPVDAILVNPPAWVAELSDGRLCDVAPTVLHLLGLSQPDEMTGTVLVRAESSHASLRAAG